MRLRPQFLILSVLLVVIPAAIATCGFYFMSRWAVPAMRDSIEQRTQLELDRLVRAVVAPLAAEDDQRLQHVLAGLDSDPSFAWVVVVDDAGARHAALGDPPAAPPRGPRSVRSAADLVVGWSEIEVEGLVLGRVGIGYHTTRASQVSTWNTILGLGAVIATLGGIVFSIIFARRFVEPIERMKQFAGAVTDGDLSHRIASADRSELGELANHLDDMTAALEARAEQLELQRSELESAFDEIRTTQEELMRSSRLAAVGEMAGRTAHEVLNPAQSLHGRLARMATDDLRAFRHNSDVLAAIVGAWREARGDGPAALMRTLAEPVGDQTALDADLASLEELVVWNRETAERATTDLEFLGRELDRITRIVDGMRSMTRQTSSIARHPLGAILAEACEIVRDGARKRHIDVRWVADSEIAVDADRYELLQVLTNLLRNAMPAIEQRHGQRGGHVELVAERRGTRIVVEVRDDGNGIVPEHLPLIFEPTFTTRSAAEGTGLGLSIARRLVRQMGGELSVESTAAGGGTTFLIDLPLAPAPTADPGTEDHRDDHAA